MANSFDFELRADDQVSAALEKINDQVKGLQPELDKTNDGLALGGQGTKDNLGDLNKLFGQLGRFAKENVQYIGDMVPPLRNFTGMAGKFGGLVGKFGLAGGAAYLAGKGIATMGGQISDAADDAYSLQIAAENAGMGVKDFTQLAGAMRLLGSDSASARGSVEGLYKTFNDALQGRNSSALAVMNQIHAGIVRNADGTANVLGTMQQLADVFPKLSPQNQKTVADALGLDADGLQLLREGARLKALLTKADEVGLTVDPKINGELVTLNRNLTDVGASWDGLQNRLKQELAGKLLSDGSVNDGIKGISKVLQHPTSGLAWEQAAGVISDKQANWIERARKDKPFMDSLSTSDQMAVITGDLNSASIKNKLQVRYGLNDQANQLQDDVRNLTSPVGGGGPSVAASGVQNHYALSVANNNPWNLRYAGQRGATPGAKDFARFGSGEEGVSAADRQLMLYYTGESKNVDHPLRTLSEIISKASPRSDGNDTPGMIQNASRELGINPDAQLNLTDPRERARVLGALFNQEGNNPYTTDRIQQIIQNSDHQPVNAVPVVQPPNAVPVNPVPVVQPATAPPVIQPSIVTPYRAPGAPVPGQPSGPSVEDMTKAFADAMKQNGMKIDLTLTDSKTGQRQTYTGSGAKVTAALPMP